MKTPFKLTSLHVLVAFCFFTLGNFSIAQNCDGKRYKTTIFSSTIPYIHVKYGSNFAQNGTTKVDLHVDIYTPPTQDTTTKRPLIILAHGGFFSMGSKTDLTWMCIELAKMGYVAATMQYRLLDMTDPFVSSNPPLAFQQEVIRAVHDMRALIRFFRKSVAEDGNIYGIDPDMVIVGGYSAGGIMANFTTYLDKNEKIPSQLQSYITAQGGLEGNSGNSGYSSKTQIALSFCGAVLDTNWIEANSQPFIALHNTNDSVVPNTSGYPKMANGMPLNVKIYGASAMHDRADNIGVSSSYLGETSYNLITGFHCDFSANAIDFVIDELYNMLCNTNNNTNSIHSQQETVDFSLYPNSSGDIYYVDIPAHSSAWTLNIIDALGQRVFTSKQANSPVQIPLNIDDFHSGIYTIQLISESGQAGMQKMVIP